MLFLPTIKVIREKLRADQIYMYLLLIRAQHAHGKALQKNGRDTINISDVAKKAVGGGADILAEITLGDPINDPKVIASVKNSDITGPESYNVSFIINKNESPVYTVDPKLQIRQKTR